MAATKRRNPVKGPLITFALMIGSVAAVGAIAHMIDARQKAGQNTPETQVATTSAASHQAQTP